MPGVFSSVCNCEQPDKEKEKKGKNMIQVKFRTIYSERYVKPGVKFKEPSLTKQAPKDECDINKIMAKYNLTGQLDHVRSMQPMYGDATLFGDYEKCLATVKNADAAFMALPSPLRDELGQNPSNLEGWLKNPDNYERGVKYGVFEVSESDGHRIVDSNSGPKDT